VSYQSRGRNLDYADIAKKGFLFGVVLFALGAVGEVAGHAFLGLPSIADQLFFGMEVTGILVGLLVPIVFGAVLPLVE
jgi:hypothetical protein